MFGKSEQYGSHLDFSELDNSALEVCNSFDAGSLDVTDILLMMVLQVFSAELDDLENNLKPITSTPRALKDFISFSEAAFDTEYSLKLKSVQIKNEGIEKENCLAQDASSISVEPESEEPKAKEDSEMWNSELTDESQDKSELSSFSFREDVIHKTMIRAVKRFYTKLFKQEFPKLFRKRIVNVRVFEILDALEKMCETYIGSECSASMAEFLLKFLGLKPKNIMQYSFSADKRAEIAISCMYNYSYGKFAKLCKVREFCLLFEHLYENHLDLVFEAEKKTLKLHNNVYRGAFQNLYVQCKDNQTVKVSNIQSTNYVHNTLLQSINLINSLFINYIF